MSVTYIILPLYVIVFVTAVCGNSLFIVAIVKNKKLHSAVFIFLANESLSDLIFTILSVFIGVEFLLQDWIFSDIFCRINGAFIEVCFTVSIVSLSTVAMERYLSICHTNKTGKTVNWCLQMSAFIWVVSILVCSPLFYAYTAYTETETKENITVHVGREQHIILMTTAVTYDCATENWSNIPGIIYFCVHGVVVYLIPLGIMLFTHIKIGHAIGKTTRPTSLSTNMNSEGGISRTPVRGTHSNRYFTVIRNMELAKMLKAIERKRKIINLLMAITLTFFFLWIRSLLAELLVKLLKYLKPYGHVSNYSPSSLLQQTFSLQ